MKNQTQNFNNVSIGCNKIVNYRPGKYLQYFPEIFCPKYSFKDLFVFALLDQKGSVTCNASQSKWYMKTLLKYGIAVRKKNLDPNRCKLELC